MQTDGPETSEASPVSGSDDSSERLSIFEDFIDQLDLGKLDDKDKPDSASDDKKT
jgi:hypothetical protein